VHRKRAQALAAVAAARSLESSAPLALDSQYVTGPGNPRVTIDLRRIADGVLENIEFSDNRRIAAGPLLPMPAAYLIQADQADLRTLLDRHGVAYRTVNTTRKEWAVEFQAVRDPGAPNATLHMIHERVVRVRGRPGHIWIDLNQPLGQLAALLLEPRSTSSLFRTLEYRSFVAAGKTLPVYRIPR
jgi:hypothetical protein